VQPGSGRQGQVPFRSVINLRPTNDEAPAVSAAGMTPFNIPVPDQHTPSYDQVSSFLQFATGPSHQPALVHCFAGQGRTGTFTATYRMVVQNWAPADAVSEAQRFLVNDDQIAWLKDFGANHLGDSEFQGFANAAGSH
jgi:protein tyrosine/serine phosphatase